MRQDVLLVDDNVLERYYERKLIEMAGLRLDEAADGEEALDLARANEYTVIIVDERMPLKDGWDTISDIISIRPESSFILMADRAQKGSEGISILKKPIEYRRLTEVISKLSDNSLVFSEEAEEDNASLDMAAGIRNCGSEEGYMEALSVYYSTISDKADEIEGYYNSGDIESYTIKVHALKSSSRIIGAKELADLAEELEFSGKANDLSAIEAKTGRLLELYRSYIGIIGPMITEPEDEQTRARVPADMLADAYASFVDFVDQMDVDLMEMVLDSLEAYELPDEDAHLIGEIRHRLSSLDWDSISKLLSEHNK